MSKGPKPSRARNTRAAAKNCRQDAEDRRRFLEFFAGGGMVRAGLTPSDWRCVYANDFDFKKALAYRRNWGLSGGCPELLVADIRNIVPTEVPDAELAWASFPCQDLSLAGGGAGLGGERSGAFYPFWNLIETLASAGRGPQVIAVENVTGTLTSRGGADFNAVCSAYVRSGYKVGALVIDAALFVPQSRPRLFVVGVRTDVSVDADLVSPEPLDPFHTRALRRAVERLDVEVMSSWVWWNIPAPPMRKTTFADVVEDSPADVSWHSQSETKALLAMMSSVNKAKVSAARRAGIRRVGSVYKRTRQGADGKKVQRAEVRFDDVAGCLRTPAGGSSRQTIIVVDGNVVRTRLISSRETARLMGLADTYCLPDRYNDAYHLTGDGVAVPVVRHLCITLIDRLVPAALSESSDAQETAA